MSTVVGRGGSWKPKVTWLNTFLSAINVSLDQGRRCCILCIYLEETSTRVKEIE